MNASPDVITDTAEPIRMTPRQLDPADVYDSSHPHVATAAFTISTGIAVTSLSWNEAHPN